MSTENRFWKIGASCPQSVKTTALCSFFLPNVYLTIEHCRMALSRCVLRSRFAGKLFMRISISFCSDSPNAFVASDNFDFMKGDRYLCTHIRGFWLAWSEGVAWNTVSIRSFSLLIGIWIEIRELNVFATVHPIGSIQCKIFVVPLIFQ